MVTNVCNKSIGYAVIKVFENMATIVALYNVVVGSVGLILILKSNFYSRNVVKEIELFVAFCL